jgi:hypothetical protein
MSYMSYVQMYSVRTLLIPGKVPYKTHFLSLIAYISSATWLFQYSFSIFHTNKKILCNHILSTAFPYILGYGCPI